MLAPSPGPGPAHQQLPALASGAPRGAVGHRVGSDGSTGWEQGSEPRCAAGPPAQPHSGCPLPAAGLAPAGCGVLARAHGRQRGTGKGSEPNTPAVSTLFLHRMQSGVPVGRGLLARTSTPVPHPLVFSQKVALWKKPALPLSPKPSHSHSALSPAQPLMLRPDCPQCLPEILPKKPHSTWRGSVSTDRWGGAMEK